MAKLFTISNVCKTVAVLLLALPSLVSCSRTENITRDILVILPSGSPESDPVSGRIVKLLGKEFEEHDMTVHIESICLSYRDEAKAGEELLNQFAKTDTTSFHPGLILAYGDLADRLLLTSGSELIESIPSLGFNVCFPDDSLLNAYNARSTGHAIIRRDLDLARNMEMLLDIEGGTPHIITELDWTKSAYDDSLRRSITRLTASEESMPVLTLSLANPGLNIDASTGEQIDVSYCFTRYISGNEFLLLKNDQYSRRITNRKDVVPYHSAVPELFGIDNRCIGGYFPDTEILVRDAVEAAKRILTEGVEPAAMPAEVHKNSRNVNFEPLRQYMDISDLPEEYGIINGHLYDRKPNLFFTLVTLLIIFGVLIFGAVINLLLELAGRNTKARADLAESAKESSDTRKKLDRVMKNAGVLPWRIEGDHFIVELYDETNDTYGISYTIEETIAKFDSFFRDRARKFFNNNEPGQYRMQAHASLDGKEPKWYEVRMNVARKVYGTTKNGISVDIENSKQSEAINLETHRLIKNAEEREGFISTMSHQIRTPLNSIVGFSQVITDPDISFTPQEKQDIGDAIDQSNKELMKVIEDILSLTHMDNTTLRVNPECITIPEFIAEVAPEATVIEGPADSSIYVDRSLLRIVMDNLLSNAVKFSAPGSPIEVGWLETIKGYVTIFVRDHGIGIAHHQWESIFQRFYKIDTFTQGTGLGLSIAREYVIRMGGTIYLSSELGHGTTFFIRFPKQTEDEI